MAARGKNKLIAYVEQIGKRVEALEASDDPPTGEAFQHIVESVVNSVRRLCAGAPAELRQGLRSALEEAGCLDGAKPNPDTTLDQLSAGIKAIAELIGEPEDAGEEEVEAPRPFRPTKSSAGEAERPDVDVTAGDETDSLAEVVKRLWEMEQPYRLVPGKDIELCLQGKADWDPLSADGRSVVDRATEPLFQNVKTAKFDELTHAYLALLDNYKRESDKRETATPEEKREMDRFLDLMDDTPHMRYVHNVLVKWDLAPKKIRDFMANVYDAWFTNYYGGTSSGFEHVFVGEEKKNREGRSEIIGLHNWLQFFREEQRGNINYLGWAKRGADDGLMISVKFAWQDDDPEVEVKTVSTFLVGTSIAFEFALATLIFFGGKDGDKPWVKIGPHDVAIQLWKNRDRMGEHVRSVYID
eukprot:CAMPEP_0170600762 /NCGR_PEP_ID=MMETSP0224-20130122/17503_1 /TAXON_ID=285029 /ORGANISM="Togula jolla, Strain CCCM 725" /LENGTH=412 /DNA_ID=CAMNT_0010925501 /DNA_START=47 /DNA_END=1285 /DNA_ORIENTATION=-